MADRGTPWLMLWRRTMALHDATASNSFNQPLHNPGSSTSCCSCCSSRQPTSQDRCSSRHPARPFRSAWLATLLVYPLRVDDLAHHLLSLCIGVSTCLTKAVVATPLRPVPALVPCEAPAPRHAGMAHVVCVLVFKGLATCWPPLPSRGPG